MAHIFNPDIVNYCEVCPPADAKTIDQKIYRGIKEQPIDESDFLSHVEGNLPKNDPNNCDHWGLSVWLSAEEAHNARGLHRFMRKWAIAEGHVTPADGVMLPTPRIGHEEHCTFWKDHNRNITGNFTIVMQPLVKN